MKDMAIFTAICLLCFVAGLKAGAGPRVNLYDCQGNITYSVR